VLFTGLETHGGPPLQCNSDMGPAEVRQLYPVDTVGQSLLKAAMRPLGMRAGLIITPSSWRGPWPTLLQAQGKPGGQRRDRNAHLAEAIQYRPRRQT
jgi:hypothetical protein